MRKSQRLAPTAFRRTPSSFPPDPLRPHPFCNTCGWRQGGIDSWDGLRCRCEHAAGPLPSISDSNLEILVQRLATASACNAEANAGRGR